MSDNSTSAPSTDQVIDAAQHIQKTVELIDSMSEFSSIRMVKHADGGSYLLLENQNLLYAKKAFYLARKGLLMVSGYDPTGSLYLDGLTLTIISAELPINARDVIVARGAMAVTNAFLASEGKADAEPYTIDCQIIDADIYIEDLKPFPETFTHEGFKYGIELSNGVKGELVVEFTKASQYLTLEEMVGASWGHRTVATEGSMPGHEILHEMSTIKIGGFEINLNDTWFMHLASSSSITVKLE